MLLVFLCTRNRNACGSLAEPEKAVEIHTCWLVFPHIFVVTMVRDKTNRGLC